MKEFEIRISGSGTKDDIVNSLKIIIEDIEAYNDDELLNVYEVSYEDETLCADISEFEKEEEELL